jgi:hypothetical protein
MTTQTDHADVLGPAPAWPGAAGRWLNAPIPAARLYAWRVGFGLFLLFDVLCLYLADYSALYGEHGYTSRAISDIHFQPHRWLWSVLRVLPQGPAWLALFMLWAVAALGLTLGIKPRLCAVIAWICSVSVLTANPNMHSGGDRLRCIQLFVMMLAPLPSRQDVRDRRLCSGWPAKFILFQLAVMYFFAGAYKLRHPSWQDGTAMYYILNNHTWCLAPHWFEAPLLWDIKFFHTLSYGSVVWEMSFPVLAFIPWTRWRLALSLGVLFHLACAVLLQVSTFPWYSLTCYLPLMAWERLRRVRVVGDLC